MLIPFLIRGGINMIKTPIHISKIPIRVACTGVSNSAYGYCWMYKEDYLKMLQEKSTP